MDWGLAKVLPRGGVADDAAARRAAAETVDRHGPHRSESDLSQAGSVMGTPGLHGARAGPGRGRHGRRAGRRLRPGLDPLRDPHRPAAHSSAAVPGELHRKAAPRRPRRCVRPARRRAVDSELAGLARDCLAREAKTAHVMPGLVAQRITTYRAGGREQAAYGGDRPRHRRSSGRRRGQAPRARRRAGRERRTRRGIPPHGRNRRGKGSRPRAVGAADDRCLAAALLVLVLGTGGGYACFSASSPRDGARRSGTSRCRSPAW